MLLQKTVIIDPYARSIVGRRQYGQLAQVRYLFFPQNSSTPPRRNKAVSGQYFIGKHAHLDHMHCMAYFIITAHYLDVARA